MTNAGTNGVAALLTGTDQEVATKVITTLSGCLAVANGATVVADPLDPKAFYITVAGNKYSLFSTVAGLTIAEQTMSVVVNGVTYTTGSNNS